MALNELALKPDKAGYSYEDGVETLSVDLPGGAPRVRADVAGAWGKASVQWTADSTDYATLRAFYAANKALPFIATLIVESAAPTKHRCYFVPGSWKIADVSYPKVVRAQLYVDPTAYVP